MGEDNKGWIFGLGFGLGACTGFVGAVVLASVGLLMVSQIEDAPTSAPESSFGEMGPRGELPAAPYIETRAGAMGYLLERDGDAVLMMLGDGQRIWMPIEELETSCRHAARMTPVRECPQ